jgi:hypothetical protein
VLLSSQHAVSRSSAKMKSLCEFASTVAQDNDCDASSSRVLRSAVGLMRGASFVEGSTSFMVALERSITFADGPTWIDLLKLGQPEEHVMVCLDDHAQCITNSIEHGTRTAPPSVCVVIVVREPGSKHNVCTGGVTR